MFSAGTNGVPARQFDLSGEGRRPVFEQTAAQMQRERMPGTRGNRHHLGANRCESQRDDWHHERLLDEAGLEIGDQTVVVGVVRVRVEALVHLRRRAEHRDDKYLEDGKPNQRRENAQPAVLELPDRHRARLI